MPDEGPFAHLQRHRVWSQVLADRHGVVLSRAAGSIIERASATDPAGTGSLGDIEHVVLLMQENRSFDHYFGTLSGVRGFGDRSAAWRQYGYAPGTGPTPTGYLEPFRLDRVSGSSVRPAFPS